MDDRLKKQILTPAEVNKLKAESGHVIFKIFIENWFYGELYLELYFEKHPLMSSVALSLCSE